MTRLAVIDHGAGNLVSIAQGLCMAGARPTITDGPEGLRDVDGIVLRESARRGRRWRG